MIGFTCASTRLNGVDQCFPVLDSHFTTPAVVAPNFLAHRLYASATTICSWRQLVLSVFPATNSLLPGEMATHSSLVYMRGAFYKPQHTPCTIPSQPHQLPINRPLSAANTTEGYRRTRPLATQGLRTPNDRSDRWMPAPPSGPVPIETRSVRFALAPPSEPVPIETRSVFLPVRSTMAQSIGRLVLGRDWAKQIS